MAKTMRRMKSRARRAARKSDKGKKSRRAGGSRKMRKTYRKKGGTCAWGKGNCTFHQPQLGF